MEKKAYLLVFTLIIVFVLSGCGDSSNAGTDGGDGEAEQKISVVTTIFPPYDFTREVAGDLVDLTMLLPPGSESHSYEPSPQDVITIQNCDLFIYGGGDSDWWVTEILSALDESDMTVLSMMNVVDVVEEEIVEGMQRGEHSHGHDDEDHKRDDGEGHGHDEDEDHSHGEEAEYDEHVWTSPKNAALITEAIQEALTELDPENGQTYETNAVLYTGKLEELDQAFQQVADQAQRTTLVFGDRFPFRYFADRYGLTYAAAFPGCSTETEASAATIAYLIDKTRDEEIPVVFHIEFSNGKIADIICEESGAKKLLLHSCHNVTRDELKSGVTYLELMEQNLTNLKEALL